MQGTRPDYPEIAPTAPPAREGEGYFSGASQGRISGEIDVQREERRGRAGLPSERDYAAACSGM